MSLCSLKSSFSKAFLLVVSLAVFSSLSFAQAGSSDNYNKSPDWEIFGGYSWANPGGNVGPFGLSGQGRGWGASVTRNVLPWVGFTLDFGGHYGKHEGTGIASGKSDVGTIMFGPRFSYRSEHLVWFGEGLAGLHRLDPAGLGLSNGFGAAVGGGLDIPFHRNFA